MKKFIPSAMIMLLWVSFCFFSSCEKWEDYRNKFEGTYTCDYMKVSQTHVILPDTVIYLHDTSYSFHVLLTVEKAEDSHKLIILGTEIEVSENGSLEFYWVPGRSISGNFYDNDSIRITQGIGKEDGYTEYWWGRL
jgi:hypothetical protein